MEELKPCPFCGGSVEVWESGYGTVKVVECKHCSKRVIIPWSEANTMLDLKETWNRRASDG